LLQLLLLMLLFIYLLRWWRIWIFGLLSGVSGRVLNATVRPTDSTLLPLGLITLVLLGIVLHIAIVLDSLLLLLALFFLLFVSLPVHYIELLAEFKDLVLLML
jgi:hypothetical protein